ncbi:hypothetical protein CA51_52160 [Rosistilla oblonga]|nr:hypothetical protein [Rosistilla oblonga]QDV15303.1 hypothetical protein CA51_52160 [Rosistilla oblonga]
MVQMLAVRRPCCGFRQQLERSDSRRAMELDPIWRVGTMRLRDTF